MTSSFQITSSDQFNQVGEGVAQENPQPIAPRLIVDINQGSRIELQSLPGIGVTLAERIVAYRSSHGAFQDVNDLVKVTGIGKKRLKRLEPFVKVTEINKVS